MDQEAALYAMLAEKPVRGSDEDFIELNLAEFAEARLPAITIHGRFQPPLHVNHWFTYAGIGFQIAQHVRIMVANPYLNAAEDGTSSHRHAPENNPFTYDERVAMWRSFLEEVGMPSNRYEFRPFEITNEGRFEDPLERNVHNLVNHYGNNWTGQKVAKFRERGYKVIHANQMPIKETSGSKIRQILRAGLPLDEMVSQLISAGYMPQAVGGLLGVLEKKSGV